MNVDEGCLFIFPGQGSQYPGMGADLHREHGVARAVYEEASDVLGIDMTALSFDDPDDEINLTRNTQPAVLTHSIACLQAFGERCALEPTMVAGHSVGEYSALVAAGAMTFATALRLVRRRGELMGQHGEGAMVALALELELVRPLAEKHYCGIAACNLPDQTVVGGTEADLDALVAEVAERHPRKRGIRLKTEGAFHTYFMVTAAMHFRHELDHAPLDTPRVPVLSNTTGEFHDADTDTIKATLFRQLFHPVLWHPNLLTAARHGMSRIVEFGGGIGKGETAAEKRPNLEGVVKKTFRGADNPPAYNAVINVETLESTLAAMGG